MNREHVLYNYNFNLAFARMLCKEIDNARRCEQPHGIPNHPAWIIGHLANTSSFAGTVLGLEPAVDPSWQQKFGRGSTPVSDTTQYDDLPVLLDALEGVHKKISEAFMSVDEVVLNASNPVERMRERFPVAGQMFCFMMTNHEMFHLGQLSAWRRALGMSSAMG